MPTQPLIDYPITHGWIRPYQHPRLGVSVNGQSAVRYLRFLQPVTIERLELKPLVYGRWVPAVPTHPAHVTISTFDPATRRWKLVRDVDLPPNPIIAGAGLHQSMTVEEMERSLARALEQTHVIDLGGLRTDLLRVECDREHPTWPNHGECNGGPYNVPFGILNSLKAFGEPPAGSPQLPAYQPPLTKGEIRPRAPRGMSVELRDGMVYFDSLRLSAGFSLHRPVLQHLGWDFTGSRSGSRSDGRATENRLAFTLASPVGSQLALSGPMLRTFSADVNHHDWTGHVSVRGNRVTYHDLTCGHGVTLDAAFTVEPDRIQLELAQTCERDLPVLEAEAWRATWRLGAAMTGAAAVPTLRPGRNGEVELPMFWAGDGNGCLACALAGDSDPATARLQVESHRINTCNTSGLVLAPRPDLDECLTLPAGTTTATWEWRVTNFEPRSSKDEGARGPAVQKHWASIYSCFRPELGGFSNNAAAVNCHVNQHSPCEVVPFTRRPANGPDPLDLYRFTIARALLDGGGYGYHRNLYLDSDPVLLSAAGRIYQADGDVSWLKQVEPALRETAARVLATLGDEGLAVCRDLSGNSGSFRWSSNAMDVVGFGHLDAYVNAWTYRALRNAAALLRDLDHADESAACTSAAGRLRDAFPRHLLNPDTGWVAGWRSRDGQLHDAAYLFVNGPALAFGLLDKPAAKQALRKLEKLRREVGAGSASYGIPFNLLPIPPADHMLPRIYGPLSSTFELYTDGAMAPSGATYYLRALQIYGLKLEAQQIANDLEEGFVRGHFNGGIGSGVEFYRWDGTPTGYEGSFVASFSPLYALALQRKLFRPTNPEWWPA